jgi:hypothetical protein
MASEPSFIAENMAVETALTVPSNLFNKYSGVLCADLYAPPILSLTSSASLHFFCQRSIENRAAFLTTGFPSSQLFCIADDHSVATSTAAMTTMMRENSSWRRIARRTRPRSPIIPRLYLQCVGINDCFDVAKVSSKSLWNGESSTTISHFNPFSISPPIIIIQPLPKPYLWSNFTSSD